MKAIVRLVLVLVLGGGAIALLLQNLAPVLSVTVLGIQLPALSLGLLMLLTCALGVLAGVGFNLFFSNLKSSPVRPPRQRVKSRKKDGTAAPRKKSQKSTKTIFGFKSGTRPKKTTGRTKEVKQPQTEGYSDWYTKPQTDWVSVAGSEYDSRTDEAWEDNRSRFGDFFRRSPQVEDDSYYATEQRSRSSQSVVDAEYRVLNAPNSASAPQQQRQRVDEWDDDFFDED
jgi:hypothetical protein